ncbi:MAG: pyridoxal phosphate-dependent class II aminotransferase [Pseudomonadota bacterium]|nr:pyridoxal phosphate-dependent class II aminotransferase [Pseudomonadota bacterium]
MLEHGGKLRRAAVEYGIPLAEWLDLSTGINPNGWPVPTLPPEVWQRLPEDDDGLIEAACACYGARHALAVAGSQAAIQALPRLFRQLHGPCRVGIVSPGYAEHAQAWKRAGHTVVEFRHSRVGGDDGGALDVLVLIHPNNPTGQTYAPETLLAWHAQLAQRGGWCGQPPRSPSFAAPARGTPDSYALKRYDSAAPRGGAQPALGRPGGWLVVDEAFMDATPAFSLAAQAHLPGLIVLRSLGKFFGLAGARVGFVLAEAALLERLRDLLGPWTLNGPARHIATLALRDTAWQAAARPQLIAAGARLADLLTRHGLPPSGGCALFQRVETPRADEIHAALARQGILTRLFETLHPQGARRFRKAAEPPTAPLPALRFGLPGADAEWTRLDAALERVSR